MVTGILLGYGQVRAKTNKKKPRRPSSSGCHELQKEKAAMATGPLGGVSRPVTPPPHIWSRWFAHLVTRDASVRRSARSRGDISKVGVPRGRGRSPSAIGRGNLGIGRIKENTENNLTYVQMWEKVSRRPGAGPVGGRGGGMFPFISPLAAPSSGTDFRRAFASAAPL